MQTLHWAALVLALVGLALVIVGVLQQRAASPSDQIIGGFGGPAGSSDVGSADGFEARSPHAHYPVGRAWRLGGLGLIAVALVLVVIGSLD